MVDGCKNAEPPRRHPTGSGTGHGRPTMLAYALSKHHHTARSGWSPLTSSARRPRIVVAAAEPRLLRLVHHKLGRAGYHVLPAADGEAALDLIKIGRAHV